ncbi:MULTISPECIES: TonB-dependent receptor [unclassified Brevundimonas]|uniref:TonB-dependent receptor n=1 Tax=unclassified Brevundimonas TaxID=2622653 RepID=UPI003F935B48
MRLQTLLLTAAGAAALSNAAWAADPGAPADPQEAVTVVPEVVVHALPLGRAGDDVGSHVALLSGDELVHRRQSTLGDTLSGIPGVNSDTFGGGASRPVVRGQAAPRVKVLSEGAGLMDASEVSPDHAISGEPLLLEGIEILRGPSALLYGGGAIGGAVNLLDKKIPTRVPADGGEGVAEFRLGSVDNEEAGVVGLTVGAGHFAVRVEAAARKTDDYKVPDQAEPRLDGSYNETSTATLGASYIGSRGYLGAAYTEQTSRYGLAGHEHQFEGCHPHGDELHCDADDGHDHGGGDAGHDVPEVRLKSRRVDVRGELSDPLPGVENVRLRAGYTDYRHDERDQGVVSTTFTNQGYDGRVEVQHKPVAGLKGVVGLQLSKSDFAAVGEESFLAPSTTKNTGLFVMEEYELGDWHFEGAARQEWQKASALALPDADHSPFSISGSAVWHFTPGWTGAVSLSRSQRAPSAQELYADGVHLATNTFEIGSSDLKVETANALELTLRKSAGATTGSVSAYHYIYDDYIFARTLDQVEDFRLIRYSQSDATFTGLEGEVRQQLTPWLSATVFGDYVRGQLKGDGGNLPRIPAARLGVRAEAFSGPWSGDVEYSRTFKQNDIAAFEHETPGFNMVNATVAYDVELGGMKSQVFLRGTNLLDELAFNHASFLAEVAPQRGRNLELGVRTRF